MVHSMRDQQGKDHHLGSGLEDSPGTFQYQLSPTLHAVGCFKSLVPRPHWFFTHHNRDVILSYSRATFLSFPCSLAITV